MTYTFEPQFFEEEILPLLTDEARQHPTKMPTSANGRIAANQTSTRGRLLRSIRNCVTRGAVRLDVRYKPVHVSTGAFHPKVILLLTEAVEDDRKAVRR